jgi:hypothetical protein
MHSLRRLLAAGCGSLILASQAALAAEWPAEVTPLPPTWRGTGGGMAIIPLVLWWLCALAWVWTVDWVGRDATKRAIAPAFWGTVCGLPLPVAAIVAWWIPWAAVGLVLMVLAWLVPIGVYAAYRNPKVAKNEQILTLGHGRRIVAEVFAQFGIDIGEPMDDVDVLPSVTLVAAGGKDAEENEARVKAASALPGFEEARQVLLGAVVARATTVTIDLGTEMAVRHEVDGVWGKSRVRQAPASRKQKESFVEAPPSSRAAGDAVSAALKALAGIEPKAATATGPFVVSVDGKPRNVRLSVRRSSTAEQLTITIEAPALVFRKFADLGMDDATTSKLGELLAAERGVILLSSPSGSGLTTTFDLTVESADRLLRDFVSIEDAAAPPREIQNVKPVRFDARTGVTPINALAEAMREYPKAIVTRDVRDKDLVIELVRLAGEGHLVIMSLKAADATEAVARVLGCGVAPRALASGLLGSLSERLVRRLCPKCREDVPTPPQVLAKLKRTIEDLPKIRAASQVGCRLCHGSGYLGRIGVFELASGVAVRKAIAAGASPEEIRKAAVFDGMRPLKESVLDLVVSGVSSIDEIQRALTAKSGQTPVPASAASAPAKKGGGPRPAPPAGAPPTRRKSP